MEQVAGELALGPLLSAAGEVDVGALGFIAAQEGFFGHDLHDFEDRGVLSGFASGDDFVDFAHGRGAAGPEDGEDFKLGVGGAWRIGWFGHYEDDTTKIVVVSRGFLAADARGPIAIARFL